MDFRIAQPFLVEITNHIPLFSIGYFSLGFVLYRESCIIYQSYKSKTTQHWACLNVRDNYFLCSSSQLLSATCSFYVFSTSLVWWKDALSSGISFNLFWLNSHLSSFIPFQNYWGLGKEGSRGGEGEEARGRRGNFLNHIHWLACTILRQHQTDFYWNLETMAGSGNVYGKTPLHNLSFKPSDILHHFLFFQLIPSSPWALVAVPPLLQSIDPITFLLIITSPQVFTAWFNSLVYIFNFPAPFCLHHPTYLRHKPKVDQVASQSWSISLNSFPLSSTIIWSFLLSPPTSNAPPYSSLSAHDLIVYFTERIQATRKEIPHAFINKTHNLGASVLTSQPSAVDVGGKLSLYPCRAVLARVC